MKMNIGLRASALLSVLAAATVATAQQSQENRTLTPFTSVVVCTPFNVAIQPSVAANPYQLQLEGPPAFRSAVVSQVVGGVLRLEASGSFTTNDVIKVLVR